MNDCPMCTTTVVCDETGCDDAARYGSSFACECTVLWCVRHAYEHAAVRAWDAVEGRDEFMCPACLTVTVHVRTEDIKRERVNP
jgi:hypothetical protein